MEALFLIFEYSKVILNGTVYFTLNFMMQPLLQLAKAVAVYLRKGI